MRVAGTALAVVLSAGVLLTAAPPAMAEDLCYRFAPSELGEATGHAWSGTVTEITRRRERRQPREFWTFDVVFDIERVHRDDRGPGARVPRDALVAGHSFRLSTRSCQGVRGLRVGQRYLVSAGDLSLASTSRTIAWRLDGIETVLVRRMYAEPVTIDPALAGADGLRAVLDLIAPEAAAQLGRASQAVDLAVASVMRFLRPGP